jgi:hypothetical protein
MEEAKFRWLGFLERRRLFLLRSGDGDESKVDMML